MKRKGRQRWLREFFFQEVGAALLSFCGVLLLFKIARYVSILEEKGFGRIVDLICAFLVLLLSRYIAPIIKYHELFMRFRDLCEENELEPLSPDRALFLNYLEGFEGQKKLLHSSGVEVDGTQLIDLNRACFKYASSTRSYYSVFSSSLLSYINAYPDFNGSLRPELEELDTPVRIVVQEELKLRQEYFDFRTHRSIVTLFSETSHIQWLWIDPVIFAGLQDSIPKNERTFGLWPGFGVMLYLPPPELAFPTDRQTHLITLHRATPESRYAEYMNLLTLAIENAFRIDSTGTDLMFVRDVPIAEHKTRLKL